MEAWNQAWATEDGREAWLKPEPFVADAVKRWYADALREAQRGDVVSRQERERRNERKGGERRR